MEFTNHIYTLNDLQKSAMIANKILFIHRLRGLQETSVLPGTEYGEFGEKTVCHVVRADAAASFPSLDQVWVSDKESNIESDVEIETDVASSILL